MKHASFFNINSMLTKHRTYPHSLWTSMKVKMFLTIDTPITAISIIAMSIGLCFKIEEIVYVNTLD